MRSLCSS